MLLRRLHQLNISHQREIKKDIRMLFYPCLGQQLPRHSQFLLLLLSLLQLDIINDEGRKIERVFHLSLGQQQRLHWLFLLPHRLSPLLVLLIHQLNISDENYPKTVRLFYLSLGQHRRQHLLFLSLDRQLLLLVLWLLLLLRQLNISEKIHEKI